MIWTQLLPLLIVLSSLLPGLAIFTLREEQQRLRVALNLGGATVKLLLVVAMIVGVARGLEFRFSVPLLPGAPLLLHGDALSLLFVALSSVLWLATTVYAIGYLETSPFRSRFFGYFSLCVSATVGIALAGNLVSFLFFYELLTLATLPLVVHWGSAESLTAGRLYLGYTIAGGALVMLGVALLHTLAGTQDFQPGGYVEGLVQEAPLTLRLAFGLMVIGFGVKAALIPMHGWLPQAMVAPVPVSALLHAVAVVKAGAFGIVRVVYDVYGARAMELLALAHPLLWLAVATTLYGSVRALQQRNLKRRLAYSTISQVSYIVLGVALLGPLAAVGGLVHLIHQGLMKVTLFYCAGVFAETLGIHDIRQLDGVGRRLPWTMTAFTLGALGMIGIPPLAGFVSKWYLGLGALQVGEGWVMAVLLLSALLNAGYFLPLLWRGWFAPPGDWPVERWSERALETHWMLLVPTLFTALLTLVVGLLAGSAISPLGWSQLIVEREFRL